jgi:hypothetical protein
MNRYPPDGCLAVDAGTELLVALAALAPWLARFDAVRLGWPTQNGFSGSPGPRILASTGPRSAAACRDSACQVSSGGTPLDYPPFIVSLSWRREGAPAPLRFSDARGASSGLADPQTYIPLESYARDLSNGVSLLS